MRFNSGMVNIRVAGLMRLLLRTLLAAGAALSAQADSRWQGRDGGPDGEDWLYVADSGNARGQIWLLRRGGTGVASVQWIRNFGGPGTRQNVAPGRLLKTKSFSACEVIEAR